LVYDNGGLYQEQRWDWYAGPKQGIVLLRQAPDRVVVVRFVDLEPTELWSVRVSNSEEFDAMLHDIAGESDAES